MSAQTPSTASPGRFFELADITTPYAIRVAATLGLADLMPATVEQLAKRTGADPKALAQLLRLLAIRGLFAETAPATFDTTPVGDLLVSDHPLGMRVALDLDGGLARSDRALAHLLHSVRTGRASYPLVFGRSFWEDLAANPEIDAKFDKMTAATKPPGFVEELAAAYDWPGEHVIDVGGGTGEQLIAILQARPDLRGTLLERPATAEVGQQHLAEAGLGDRAAAVAGDFLRSVPAGDVYVLVNVLHDWGDEEALEILRRCAEAGGPAARMLVVERLDVPDDYAASTLNLRMLVNFGGRQRSLDELRDLAAAVGRDARTVGEPKAGMSLIECGPATEAHST